MQLTITDTERRVLHTHASETHTRNSAVLTNASLVFPAIVTYQQMNFTSNSVAKELHSLTQHR